MSARDREALAVRALERGWHTLPQLGHAIGLTKQGARQVIKRLKKRYPIFRQYVRENLSVKGDSYEYRIFPEAVGVRGCDGDGDRLDGQHVAGSESASASPEQSTATAGVLGVAAGVVCDEARGARAADPRGTEGPTVAGGVVPGESV